MASNEVAHKENEGVPKENEGVPKENEEVPKENEGAPKKNELAIRENKGIEELKIELSLMRQKLQDQREENERLLSQLKKKDKEIEMLNRDNAAIQVNYSNLVKNVTDELEACQEANTEKQCLMKVSNIFIELIESELQCIICREVIITVAINLPCYHLFCNMCICKWYLQRKECPCCGHVPQKLIPCITLDTFITKLIQTIPDKKYQLRRLKTCKERVRKQSLVLAEANARALPQEDFVAKVDEFSVTK